MFSLNRFYSLLKRDLVINGKTILWVFLVSVALAIVFLVFPAFMKPSNMVISDTFYAFYRVFSVITLILASIIPFRNYDKKYNRSCEILLPSSLGEKFAVNCVMAFIVLPILTFAALFIGMEIGHLINWIRFDRYVFLYKESFYHFSHLDDWLMIYWFMGFSFFGAVLFKKNKLIKTWAIVFGVFCLFATLFSIHILINHPDLNLYDRLYGKTINIVANIIFSLLFILCLIGAYFKLKKERS